MKIQSIAIPIFIDMILTFSMFFVDTLFLSQISDEAAAGVGTTIPVFVICVILFLMTSQGAANVASQRLGAGKAETLPAVYGAALVIALGLGVVVVFVVSGLMPLVFSQLGMPGDTGSFAGIYLRFISIALVFYGLRTVIGAVCMTQGRPDINMYVGITSAALNIPLNFFFMFSLGLGIYGVILATILAQVVAVALGAFFIFARLKVRISPVAAFTQGANTIKVALRFGLPAAVQPISAELLMLAVAFAAVQLGTVEMAARIYVMNFMTIAICWSSAWSIGNQIVLAGAVGGGNHDGAHELMHRHLLKGVLSTLLIVAVLWAFGKPLLGLFTQSPEIIQLGLVLMALSLIHEPLKAAAMIISFSLKASGDTVYPAQVSVAVNWLISLPVAYLLAFESGLGIVGLWLALILDELLRSTINYLRWRKGGWRQLETA
ncbi:Multidrug resistance protein NorM [Pseudovibrio axinellae]|uniref:Multidrug resistance protein NorM n=1 Tax=Pseudovibrio axinellae TaxID=989403 RepID=A0A165U0L8_9HYPH|nr:MATE family efflux transporter [Pseudovibrio axinellae]KZL09096.1 Multidrug resistance protein NorM [Pseudovibrio axinellae]SER75210.1 putative efflux protein, MATE family [Pseudovibrio axinellae]